MKQDANLSVLEDIPEQPLGDIAFQRKIIAKAQICLPREPLNLFLSLSSEFIERHLDLLGQIAILFMARAENVDLFRTLPEEVRNNADFLTSVISGMRTCHIGGADSVLRALRSDFVLTHRDLVMQMLAWYGETRDCLAIFSEIPNAMQMDLTFTIDVVRQAKAQKIPFAIDEIQQHVPEEHKEILRKEWEKGCCCTIL